MKRSFEQGILKYLAAVAVAFSAGVSDPMPDLLRMPAGTLVNLVDELEDGEPEDRKRLLNLLAHDPRPAVRARVAEGAASLWQTAPADSRRLLQSLVCDASGDVRAAAALAVEQLLQSATPMDRIALVAEWATSSVPEEREALAAALRGPTPVFIADLAIAELAIDPEPAVRRYAMEAAGRHYHEDPVAYAQIATRGATDSVRSVRREARRVLGHAPRA